MHTKIPQEKPKTPQSDTPIQAKENAAQGGTATFEDQRPGLVSQRKLRAGMADNPRNEETAQLRKSMQDSASGTAFPIQRKANQTGLPDQLKSGIENLSGYSMDDVRVHFNSSKPAQLQAHAYAQGSEIHVAPGQEKHLPHEAWHVVQQKQGRVKPTRQLKSRLNINDDAGLEKEADVMGAKAMHGGVPEAKQLKQIRPKQNEDTSQLKKKSDGAKVGLEIETTLPVRKHSNDEYVLEVMEEYRQRCMEEGNGAGANNAKGRPRAFLQNILRNMLDLSPKEVIYQGNGWRAEADHTTKLENLYNKGHIFTKACAEIVTDPIADIEEATRIMNEIHEWIAETLMVAKETTGMYFNHAKETGYMETYVIEMPDIAVVRNELLVENGNEVLGNFQINLGGYMEDVISLYQDNIQDVKMPGFRRNQEDLIQYLANDNLWAAIWKRCEPLLENNLIEEGDEPFLRSIMFQYLYEYCSYAMRDRGMTDTLKNSYMIMRKTAVHQQVALSQMPSKNKWANKELPTAFSKICRESFLNDEFLTNRVFQQDIFEAFPNVFANMASHNSALPYVEVLEVNKPEQLILDNGRSAGVFELRGMQGKLMPQNTWLGIWLHYLDQENNPNPYSESKLKGKFGTGENENVEERQKHLMMATLQAFKKVIPIVPEVAVQDNNVLPETAVEIPDTLTDVNTQGAEHIEQIVEEAEPAFRNRPVPAPNAARPMTGRRFMRALQNREDNRRW